MKFFLAIVTTCLMVILVSCSNEKSHKEMNVIHFATSAEYPPFEYQEHGILKGYDIDLGKLIAKELGKEAQFDNMQFSSILPALAVGQVDAAISTITITPSRRKNFDLTRPYYFEGLATIFKKEEPVVNVQQLTGKKVAVQLGTTMEVWLRKNLANEMIMTVDNNNQAVAALKAGHVDVVLIDGAQGAIFSKKNPGLAFALIVQAEDGYGIALKKNSPLTAQINQALTVLEKQGELKKLNKVWLGSAQ